MLPGIAIKQVFRALQPESNRRLVLILFSLSLPGLPSSVLAQPASKGDTAKRAPILKMVISNWPPYKGGELREGGIATDITRQVLTRAGFKTHIKIAPWQRALNSTIQGTYDLTPAVWKTSERDKTLHFTAAILDSRIIVLSLKSDDFTYKRLEDLKGKTIGVGRGWAYPDTFMKADYFTREEATDLKTNINKLLHGRFKLVAAEAIAAKHTIDKYFKNKAALFKFSQVAIQHAPLHVAFSRKNESHEKIARRFNAALKTMKSDGSYKKLLKAHGIGQ